MKYTFQQNLTDQFFLICKFSFTGALIAVVMQVFWGSFSELKYTAITGFLIGLFVGLLERLFSSTKINRLPYTLILILRSISYFLITVIIVYIVLLIYLKSNGYESSVFANPVLTNKIQSIYFLTNLNMIYILIITLVSVFIWQLKDFFSKGILINYLLGRYHHPMIENRIFMFLDLNDATKHAENLGPRIYSSYISDFFSDIDRAITESKGEVFQYVGDEVVIIWKPIAGLKNNNCIKAYILAKKILEEKETYYQNKYKISPSFKAAIHFGEITITEIGISKKEIVYHGDTINTTARICASAHSIGHFFLISEQLAKQLNPKKLTLLDLGEHQFKGKEESIRLFSLKEI